jgi:hypothetical protein
MLFPFADAAQKRFRGVFMSQAGNSENRFGGQYMIQDRDHMSEISQTTDEAKHGDVRQSEQSQQYGRQQGAGDRSASRQQGDGRSRQSY